MYGTIEDITRNPLSKVGEVGNGERKGKRGDRGFYMFSPGIIIIFKGIHFYIFSLNYIIFTIFLDFEVTVLAIPVLTRPSV